MTAASWVPGADGSPYGVQTLPYGVFLRGRQVPTVGVRVADFVLDLAAAERVDLVDAGGAFFASTLNAFMALGPTAWDRVRGQLVGLLTDPAARPAVEPLLVPLAECTLQLPFEVADYVDFYSSEQHASNVGQIFRPGQPPLQPNWKHLPIGYHGRAGTVVVSGTDVVRPCGQRREPGEDLRYGPSVRLDIEAEVGFVVGVPSALGEPVPRRTPSRITCSASCCSTTGRRATCRPTSTVPLGPFLGKSFATSISAWVTPLAALAAARVPAPQQDPPVARYLARDRAIRLRPVVVRGVERHRGVAATVPDDVLDAGPAAGAHDVQRCVAADRRSLRLGHRLRSGSREQPDRSWNVRGTAPSR